MREKRSERRMIYGIRPIMEAIKNGQDLDKVMLQKGARGELMHELTLLLKTEGIPVQYVPVETMDRLLPQANHQGVTAYISSISYTSLEQVLPMVYDLGKAPLILLFDRVTDVRNFGAMARSAECAGVDAIVIPTHNTAAINEDAIKASAGALLSVPICREENLKTAINFLRASGLKVVAVTEKGSTNYTNVSYIEPTAFILGSEEDGVSPEYIKLCDEKVSIPMFGNIESLNVSVANGILLYEAVRQRSGAEE